MIPITPANAAAAHIHSGTSASEFRTGQAVSGIETAESIAMTAQVTNFRTLLALPWANKNFGQLGCLVILKACDRQGRHWRSQGDSFPAWETAKSWFNYLSKFNIIS